MGLGSDAVTRASSEWEALDELMSKTSQELANATTTGLGSQCRPAAARFLQAWSGYAEESATAARGFSTALTETLQDARVTDHSAQGGFTQLDGRLGTPR